MASLMADRQRHYLGFWTGYPIVLDGRTFQTSWNEKFRLRNVKVPMVGEPGCSESKEELTRWIHNRPFFVQPTSRAKDGALIVEVSLAGGDSVNEMMRQWMKKQQNSAGG